MTSYPITRYRGKVQMIFTSPPFPLNRKKKYGNLQGEKYVEWLSSLATLFRDYLTPDGSIVIELGNAWERGKPIISTLTLEALLAFKKNANLNICQEFICFNPARLPSPAQWVNVERCRVKDAFTRIWWMSPIEKPKADNRRILTEYSESMKKLLERGTYNAGRRPSEHNIGERSFLNNNGGAIPPNVLVPSINGLLEGLSEVLPISNTKAYDSYQRFCREFKIETHPARMPEKLVEFFIKFLTDKDDLILDPFGGSNTTGWAAEKFRRKWISIETDLKYILGSIGRFDSQNNSARTKKT